MQIRKTRSQIKDDALAELRLIIKNGEESYNPEKAAREAKGYLKCMDTVGLLHGAEGERERKAFKADIDKLFKMRAENEIIG